jgi:hypothetical protein
MKMKPLPRLLLIIAAVGGAFFGINTFMSKGGSMPAPMDGQTASPVAPAAAAPTAQAPQAPQAAPVDPVLTPSTSTDTNAGTNAGLSKLLNSGAKK